MRLRGQSKMGYYPTPNVVIDLIKKRLDWPDKGAVLDPCCGEGTALARLVEGREGLTTYGIELDDTRSIEAVGKLSSVLHCAVEETRIAHRSFSLLFLNPPYDWEHEEGDSRATRKEVNFLKRCAPYLADDGILVYLIPESVWESDRCRNLLAAEFKDLEAWRFPEGEFEAFKQWVVIGRKRKGDDPEPPLRICQGQKAYTFSVPPTKREVKLFQTTRVRPEDAARLVAKSPVWKKFKDAVCPVQTSDNSTRPPLPLHSGHLALMLASGCLDGVVGNNGDSHVVKGKVWKDQRTTQTIESTKTGDGTVTVTRHLDDYRVSIKILDQTGTIREVI